MDDIEARLRQAGHRITRSRKAIIRALTEAEGWLRPEEIHSRGQAFCPSLGLVTVYRTLNLLTKHGYATRIHMEDGCHGYARSHLSHGHHLICRGCQQVVEFPGLQELPIFIEQIAQSTGFLIENHMLELLGLCPYCQSSMDGGLD